jgi:hypothetical protein
MASSSKELALKLDRAHLLREAATVEAMLNLGERGDVGVAAKALKSRAASFVTRWGWSDGGNLRAAAVAFRVVDRARGKVE